MPWKGERNPYLIWLSEVILQQTRVEQGLPYFESFRRHFPTVQQLADADEDKVMKLWQGLGYYSRARNLHFTAKFVSNTLDGVFPKAFQDLKMLKGVGDYTAAAIASFAFGEAVAVVDGNVIRVLARFFGIEIPFDTTEGKKHFNRLAQSLISHTKPAAFNQAIMDFGATVCTPKNPDCANCLLAKNCFAAQHELAAALPVRSKKLLKRERHFNFIVFRHNSNTFIRQRNGNDIWKKLYEFPLIEGIVGEHEMEEAIELLIHENSFSVLHQSAVATQMLTHQKLHIRFVEVELHKPCAWLKTNFKSVKISELHQHAFPKTLAAYVSENFPIGKLI